MIKKLLCVVAIMFLSTNICLADSESKNQPPPKATTQQLREMQSKTYNTADTILIMKAILNILQDNYFFINQADSKIGFIRASREFDTRDKYIDIKEEFGCSKKMAGIKRYSITRTEANINVTLNKDTKTSTVRLSVRKKILNMYDVEVRTEDIEDPSHYNAFFELLNDELNLKPKTE